MEIHPRGASLSNGTGSAIARGTTLGIPLPAPVSLETVYWTAWVEEGGRLQLSDDVYDRDR